MKATTTTLIACVALGTVACAGPSRVLLEAPGPDASIVEREKAYDELRPLEQVEHVGVAVNRVGNTTVATPYRQLAYLQLNDGRRVIDPRDLAPVVTTSSPTGKAIEAYDARMSSAQTWYLIGTGIFAGAGLVMGTAGAAAYALTPADDNGFASGGQFLGIMLGSGGLSLLLTAPAMGVLFMLPDSTEAQRERETAFNLYDRSLRMRLDLENTDR